MFILSRCEVDSLITVMLDDDSLLTVMLDDNSSSDDSSYPGDENHLDLLLVCALFPELSPSDPRLNLADLTHCQCETIFR